MYFKTDPFAFSCERRFIEMHMFSFEAGEEALKYHLVTHGYHLRSGYSPFNPSFTKTTHSVAQ